jgi:hypothetical protein
MAKVLTLASSVLCGHAVGKVTTVSANKLRVNGSPVLSKEGIAGKSVAGCKTPLASDASGSPTAQPCTSVVAVAAGGSMKLKVNGNPVMLETLEGSTNGMVAKETPQKLLHATAGPVKLDAV